MAKVIAEAGHQVVASDLCWMDGNVFPVVGGVDALQSRLPAGVRSIVTNPPYQQEVLWPLVDHWLNLLEPVGGQLCLLLRSGWGESQKGQMQTTRHPAYHGRIKLPRSGPVAGRHHRRQRRLTAARSLLAMLGLEPGCREDAVRDLGRRSAVEGVRGVRRLARRPAPRRDGVLEPLSRREEPAEGEQLTDLRTATCSRTPADSRMVVAVSLRRCDGARLWCCRCLARLVSDKTCRDVQHRQVDHPQLIGVVVVETVSNLDEATGVFFTPSQTLLAARPDTTPTASFWPAPAHHQ